MYTDLPRSRSRRRGEMSPLVSLAIAGGIGALILYGVVNYGNDTREEAKADDFYNEVNHVATQFRARYSSDYTRFGGWNGSIQRLSSLNMVPQKFVDSGNAITPYGGSLLAEGTSRTTFSVWLRHSGNAPVVPTDACVSVVSRLSGTTGINAFWGDAVGTISASPTHAQSVSLCNASLVTVIFN